MNKQSLILEGLIESRILESNNYDFSKEEDRKKACKEYSKCMQNNLSSSAERRMDELDRLAGKEGLKFNMVNYSQWVLPRSLVSPEYELINK